MNKPKRLLQKISMATGIISLLLALVSCVFLLQRIDTIGDYNPITASIEASIFFFSAVGFVLIFIGRSDIPKLTFDK